MNQQVKKNQESNPVSLSQLEFAIVHKKYLEAEAIISNLIELQLLSRLDFIPKLRQEKLTFDQIAFENYQVIERIASLITILMSDQNYQVSEQFYAKLTMNKRFINNLFSASGYGNTEHIVRNLSVDNKTTHSRQDIMKLLVLITPESSFSLPWDKLVKFMPNEVLRAYMGLMFCSELNISEQSTNQLNTWADMAKTLPLLNFNTANSMTIIASAYFNMSSLTGKGKFEFKKWAVRNFEQFMNNHLSKSSKQKIAEIPNKAESAGKKVVLIIHDHYRKGHAMYRCYRSMIAGLKEEFRVIGLSQTGFVDTLGKQDHHEYYEYDDFEDLEKIVQDVLIISPDVILYPSIGMGQLALFLASIRLAPIQCVCPGHPSSTYFTNIDYMLLEDLGIKKENLEKILTETPIVIDSKQIQLELMDFHLEETDILDKDICNVVINGVITKVTVELMNVCKKISKQSEKAICFHFFMSSPRHDIEYYSALSILRRELPNSILHSYSNYNTYMNNLSLCDFALPTLPFGGANSNLDLVRLGIPKLYILDERDLPGATDYYMWNEFGELDGLCEGTDELIKRAVEFANDQDKFASSVNRVKSIKLDKFFSNSSNDKDDRLVRSINQIIN